ncbi:ATP-binding cassette domain-containing protein [Clostridium sp. MCC353]|uniref:ABC transporter ATP-binding protein n=1 Tax=Clostridium sp. MCC353 TaxID=2592646 RepID=UPI001C02B426|nr:ABC transporter ATP-binding protein [Clostridium sp. MCC353]MBT9779043.1 ATP-binding cassette domain-containing protein [Clostridium sp. MCC353]
MEQYLKCKLEVKNITKTFFTEKGKFEAIKDVSFQVNEGEFLVLLGPGRCGKSVLLNIISGLLDQTSGAVYYDGEEIHGVTPQISMVFQKIAIMPFKTVRENVELGLKFAGVDKKERNEISQHYIDLVGLNGFENSYPTQLSGGMKQRVGIARAYATHPQVLIMDEPFGQLDAQTRYSMQNEILRISGEEKKTIIFVTNNIEEACSLGDRIVLLSSCPAQVKAVYDMSFLPKPRDIVSEEFLTVRQKISDNTDLAL